VSPGFGATPRGPRPAGEEGNKPDGADSRPGGPGRTWNPGVWTSGGRSFTFDTALKSRYVPPRLPAPPAPTQPANRGGGPPVIGRGRFAAAARTGRPVATLLPPPPRRTLVEFANPIRPGNHVLRRDPTTGRAWACIPMSPVASSEWCDHCAAPPRNPVRPFSLCRYHSYFLSYGVLLRPTEQRVLEVLDRRGFELDTLQCRWFVLEFRRRIAYLELLANSEPLPSISRAGSLLAAQRFGVIGEEVFGPRTKQDL